MLTFSLSKKTAKILGLFLTVVSIAACSSSPKPDTIYQRVSDAKLKPGDSIPAPKDTIIISVTGKIGTKNSGDAIQMDMPTIESVGLVDYKVNDPFEKRPTVF